MFWFKFKPLLIVAGFLILFGAGIWMGWVLPARLANQTLGNNMLQTPGAAINISGMPVCLPHKDNSGPQTLECAIGLKGDDGNYYTLLDADNGYQIVGKLNFNSRVTITGVYLSGGNDKYQSVGTIKVSAATQ